MTDVRIRCSINIPYLVIRKVLRRDRLVWAHMRMQLWSNYSLKEHLGHLARISTSKKHMAYMAILPEGPIGFAEVSIRPRANGCTKQPAAFLDGIWIEPEHRRKRIGQALIEHASSDLIAHGFDELWSDAGIRDRQLHVTHDHWGFAETERVVYFRKALANQA